MFPIFLNAQSNNHWTRNFNEESSLLSGAVVGGGAGPSAIYYNPASISEITESKLSLHASLFSFEFIDIKNALGEGVDLNYSRGVVVPRFISYMIKPKNYPRWRLEIAFLNNENYKVEFATSVDKKIDILSLPGEERYFSYFSYRNTYKDDYVGVGGSYKLGKNVYVGLSMFVSFKSVDYNYSLSIEASPLDSVFVDDVYVPFYSASYGQTEYLRFNDYRLLWKLGFLYKKDRLSIGLNITTPSIGGIYSDGKKIMRKEDQNNITYQETGESIPNYVLVDYKERKDMFVNPKSTLSVAAGVTYNFKDGKKTLFTTIEYFAGIDPYKMVQANENPDIGGGTVFDDIDYNNWLTLVGGAKPVLNVAAGYKWKIKETLLIMAGFRTDFNYLKSYDYGVLSGFNKVKGLDIDMYHITGGLSVRIFGQDLITGLQYTYGREPNQKQFANLSDPVEYNTTINAPLQGTPQNTMTTLFNAISIYFGATFNFGANK